MYTGCMALFIRQQGPRSELQEKIALELQEKIREDKALQYEKPASNYEQQSHVSKNLGPVVVLIASAVVLGVVYLLVSR